MEIVVAKTAGFCFGVKRAVDAVYDEINRNTHIATFGKLIHNNTFTKELKSKGVEVVNDIDSILPDTTLVIRTHGVGKNIIDKMVQKGIKYIDLTCPYVKKIHNIVHEYYENGYNIMIVGDKNHPEVIGINGWCDENAIIAYNINEINIDQIKQKPLCVVAQTTINRENFDEIINFAKNYCQNTVVFDTICSATKNRQEEAAQIAKQSDVMFVIGGKDSSNTMRLYEICKENCNLTYHLETFEDIPQNINLKNKKIGVTAGASTPCKLIEEVLQTMDEMNKNTEEMDFAQMYEQSLKTLNIGDVVKGVVVEIRPNEVIVDLGFKSDGIISASELTDDPDVKPADMLKIGDEIDVFVIGVNDAEGKTILSKKKLDSIAGWQKIEDAYENGEILEGKVVQTINGGIILLCNGTRVFVPASQASDRYMQDLNELVGKTYNFRIIEVNQRRKRVVGSIRSVLVEQKKALEEKFWADCEVGKKYNGVVKSLTNFGAFVDIGGVDGLVHISELSWSRIKHPSEVVKEGDMVEVYVKEINPETKKISLGFKKAEDNPWVIAQSKFNVGDVVEAKVVRLLPFGAFVELMPSIDGLIHISQIANRRIGKPEDELSIGQTVTAKITDINWETKKISLSIRALLEPEVKEEEPAENTEDEVVYKDGDVVADDAAADDAE